MITGENHGLSFFCFTMGVILRRESKTAHTYLVARGRGNFLGNLKHIFWHIFHPVIWLLSIHSHWSATKEMIKGDSHGLLFIDSSKRQ